MCLSVVQVPRDRQRSAENREADFGPEMLRVEKMPATRQSHGLKRGKVVASLPIRVNLRSPSVEKQLVLVVIGHPVSGELGKRPVCPPVFPLFSLFS